MFDDKIDPPIDIGKIEERRKEIFDILNNMVVLQSTAFDTDNIHAWRSSFDKAKDKFNRNQIVEKKFTIKKQKTGGFRIWRIK